MRYTKKRSPLDRIRYEINLKKIDRISLKKVQNFIEIVQEKKNLFESDKKKLMWMLNEKKNEKKTFFRFRSFLNNEKKLKNKEKSNWRRSLIFISFIFISQKVFQQPENHKTKVCLCSVARNLRKNLKFWSKSCLGGRFIDKESWVRWTCIEDLWGLWPFNQFEFILYKFQWHRKQDERLRCLLTCSTHDHHHPNHQRRHEQQRYVPECSNCRSKRCDCRWYQLWLLLQLMRWCFPNRLHVLLHESVHHVPFHMDWNVVQQTCIHLCCRQIREYEIRAIHSSILWFHQSPWLDRYPTEMKQIEWH